MQRLVIVGNGYFPYLAAIFLRRKLKQRCPALSLVDLDQSDSPKLIQSLSSMRGFHGELKLPEVEFVKKTRAEMNLGFRYTGFSRTSSSKLGPVSSAPQGLFVDAQYGFNLEGRRFHYLYRKLLEQAPGERYADYCLSAQLAEQGHFTPPSPNANSIYSTINYGYRLTQSSYKAYLASQLSPSDVSICHTQVESLHLNAGGFVEGLQLSDGARIDGDFFIDASAERVVKAGIGDPKSTTFESIYPENLNLGLKLSQQIADDSRAYGKLSASSAGLELSSSIGSSEYLHTIVPLARAEGNTGGATTEVRPLKGQVDNSPWLKNCVTMGEAFTDRLPIFIDNSHLHQNSLSRLLDMWPRTPSMEQESLYYNRSSLTEFDQALELDVLHLATAFARPDYLSEPMTYKRRAFLDTGKVVYYESELLQEEQWPALFYALGLVPRCVDLSVAHCKPVWVAQELNKIKSTLSKAAVAAPNYSKFLRSAHRTTQ